MDSPAAFPSAKSTLVLLTMILTMSPALRDFSIAGGPYVLGAGQAFFEETELLGAGLAFGLPVGHGNAAQSEHECQGEKSERSKDRAHTPVLSKEKHEHTQEQQRVAKDLHGKLGEKGRKRVHVAVYTLDHLARRVCIMKGHIQAQAVFGQVGAHLVCRRPTHVLADIGRDDRAHLLRQGHADEQHRRAPQCVYARASFSGIDKVAHDLRVDQLQADAAEQEHCQKRGHPPLGTKVIDQ
jgi:hypothetical protein